MKWLVSVNIKYEIISYILFSLFFAFVIYKLANLTDWESHVTKVSETVKLSRCNIAIIIYIYGLIL